MTQSNPTAKGRWIQALNDTLGEPAPVAWKNVHVIGPFDNTGHRALFAAYPPENAVDLLASYPGKNGEVRWTPMPELEGEIVAPIDLGRWIAPGPWCAVYLFAELESGAPQIGQISAGALGMVHGWFNRTPTLVPAIPTPMAREDNEGLVAIGPGTNTLLLKVLFLASEWTLDCRAVLYGEPGRVATGLERVAETARDPALRLVARYAVVEVHAVQNHAAETRTALKLLREDPIATRWDSAWAAAVEAQHEATGSFLPLHDALQRYAPVDDREPAESFWPQSVPPELDLLVVDASESTPSDEFALSVLQGIVNRKKPRLYLIHANYGRQDRQWLDELHREGFTSRTIPPAEAWKTFREEIRGAVLYDGTIMDEIGSYYSDRLNQTNVLMMIGSLEDAVPLTPETNEALGFPVVFDARDRWSSQYEAMQWAYRELFPRMNRRVLATCYPGIFYLTDYLVQFRVFTFWFPEHRTLPEQNLLRGILASTPPNTPIIGWWFDWMPNVPVGQERRADAVMEAPGLLIGSYFGKVLTPSHEATNLSVHSGVAIGDHRHESPAIPELDRSKVYFAYLMSDGDNLGEALMMRTRDLQWDGPERGSVPMGWSFAPAAARMAPTVLNYYLRTVTPADLLVGGLGVGYTHPTVYLRAFPERREALYAEYARMTEKALASIDTTCLWLIDGGEDDEDRYARASTGRLQGIFTGYGGSPETASARLAPNDVVAFRPASSNTEYAHSDRERLIGGLVEQLRRAAARTDRPAFLEAWLLNWDWRMDMLHEVGQRLGPGFVCVRPDVLVSLRRRA